MTRRVCQIVTVMALLLATTVAAQADKPASGHYLFSYFVGNGEDGLHLAHSTDGYTWQAVREGRSLLKPEAGRDRLMRDPSIAQGPDGGFHLVWTVSWGERGIGYSSSRDLLQWTPQRTLHVMEHEPDARNCWAPELFYDDRSKRFLIVWSTTIPGRFPETDGQSRSNESDPGLNHRLYCLATEDFMTFSDARLFYDQGFNVIDATLLKADGRYAMLLKDETDRPYKPEKNIRLAWSDRAEGPYGPPSEPITGDYWAEGPTALKIGDKWFVYFDKYRDSHYGLVTSTDLEHWNDELDKLRMPPGIRHGTAFPVSAEIAAGLLE